MSLSVTCSSLRLCVWAGGCAATDMAVKCWMLARRTLGARLLSDASFPNKDPGVRAHDLPKRGQVGESTCPARLTPPATFGHHSIASSRAWRVTVVVGTRRPGSLRDEPHAAH